MEIVQHEKNDYEQYYIGPGMIFLHNIYHVLINVENKI